ncbi:hypothetical protein CEXT_794191 [Caerostris extrusa]|uniref:Uncharacterized protein n=1 Tax=Caerostris extrusa TaxID=172846 RepID=A0AAV4SP22_CAEEX|nr:hypothetical protein CEXT_794191 [Caerostris extrusa]
MSRTEQGEARRRLPTYHSGVKSSQKDHGQSTTSPMSVFLNLRNTMGSEQAQASSGNGPKWSQKVKQKPSGPAQTPFKRWTNTATVFLRRFGADPYTAANVMTIAVCLRLESSSLQGWTVPPTHTESKLNNAESVLTLGERKCW